MAEKKKGLIGRAASAVKDDLAAGKESSAEQAAEREAQAAVEAEEQAAIRQEWIERGDLFEYKCVSIRETLVGDKIPVDKVEKAMNEGAAEGWRVKSVTSVTVGRSGASGVIVTFERPAQA